jgi:FtsP/CotA-like multicopper oxidase with cupredoxin domain
LNQNMETFAGNASSINQMDSMPMDEEMSMDSGNNMEHSNNQTGSIDMDRNIEHSTNGFIFGSMSGLNMTEGERARWWYLLGMGREMACTQLTGTVRHCTEWNACVDGIEVFPATTRVPDMVPDDPSTWLYRCHVNEHIDNGMKMLFTVRPANTTGTIG